MAAAAYLVAHPEVPHGPVKVAFNPDEEIGRGVIHFPVDTFGAVAAYTVDGSTAGEMQQETFSGAQVRMKIRGRAIHPGWAKGELVNAVKLAAEVIERLPKDRLSPETTEEREGYVHPIVISGDSSEVEIRFIVRDFENDLLDAARRVPARDRRGRRGDRRSVLDRGRVEDPVPEHARHAPEPSARSSRTSRRRSGASGSSRRRPRSAAAPTAPPSPRWACRRRTSSRAATTPTASASGSASRTWASPQPPSSSSQTLGRSLAPHSRAWLTAAATGYPVRMEPLLDTFGRPLETLRVSITDRCNFRCVYCMPKEVFGRDYAFLERNELLSFEEIERVVRVFAELGVRTVRITGGEPLVRRNVEHLVELLAAIPGLELALTTNGALLPQKAEALARAGLDRVTVSLDSVDDRDVQGAERRRLPRRPRARGDRRGRRRRAARQGERRRQAGRERRRDRRARRALPRHAARASLHRVHGRRKLERLAPRRRRPRRRRSSSGSARSGRSSRSHSRAPTTPPAASATATARARSGVIASVTKPFCGGCSRARLSAEGKLYTCLFAVKGHDLREPLRSGASDEELALSIRSVWHKRSRPVFRPSHGRDGGLAEGRDVVYRRVICATRSDD